ncbi:MAG: hypothetical protein M1831_000688 [Alyxoria varia]|nr:MAG: hypothetical protein M1831_000688 [Alyxoria varia]
MNNTEGPRQASANPTKLRVYAQPPDSDVAKEIGNLVASPEETFPHMDFGRTRSLSSDFTDDGKQNHMRHRWEEAMQQNLEISHGYERVGVLIVKWADELDELNTGHEVDRLAGLFREKFKYETKVLELASHPIPRHQLSSEVAMFIKKFDSEQTRNLMIVYYTGHAEWHDHRDGLLYLTAKKQDCDSFGRRNHKIPWNSTEINLLDAQGDVLTIFDACFASNLVTAEVFSNVNWEPFDEKLGVFEHLSAAGYDEITPLPGKDSFTNALITSLEDLLGPNQDHHFSTYQLQQRMTKMRPSRAPWLSNRLMPEWDRHIRLGPLKKFESMEKRPYPPNLNPSFLLLEFELGKSRLEDEEIDGISKALAQAWRESPIEVRGVDWRGLCRRRQPLREAVAKVQRTEQAMRAFSQALSEPESAAKRKHQGSDASMDDRGLARARTSPLSPKDDARSLSRDESSPTLVPDHLSPNATIQHLKTC